MAWFKNLRTVVKLMILFCFMSIMMAFIGYQGLSASSTLNGLLDSLYANNTVGISAAKDAGIQVAKIGREARTVVLEKDDGRMNDAVRETEKEFSALDAALAQAEKTADSEEEKTLVTKIRELSSQFETEIKDANRLAVVNTDVTDKQAWDKLTAAKAIADHISDSIERLSTFQETSAKKSYDDSDVVYANARNRLIAVLVASILLALGVGYFIAALISRPLLAAVCVLDKVSAGDMTAKLDVSSKDEVGRMARSLNEATEAMRTALSEVRDSAENMATSAEELASASEELASGAQEQAASLEETTATLEEITSTVKQNADNAKQANQVTAASRDTAEKGGQVVSEAVGAMGEINEASKNIAEIITTIDEIAFQTNLLALNAAVEAARAGEQGRGFAVVATEVRNLAQRSATSAKEIKRLIQDSVRKVENGSGLVNKSGETLQEIVGSVKKVTDIVAEIASASREQSTGIEQVNKAMLQMDQVTQTNSSQTEELSSTAQSLSAHAQQLQALVARFRVDTGDARSKSGPKSAQSAGAKAAAKTAHKPAAHTPARAAAAAAGAGPGAASAKVSAPDHNDANAFTEF